MTRQQAAFAIFVQQLDTPRSGSINDYMQECYDQADVFLAYDPKPKQGLTEELFQLAVKQSENESSDSTREEWAKQIDEGLTKSSGLTAQERKMLMADDLYKQWLSNEHDFDRTELIEYKTKANQIYNQMTKLFPDLSAFRVWWMKRDHLKTRPKEETYTLNEVQEACFSININSQIVHKIIHELKSFKGI